jgi:hypothetical protein
MVSTCSAEELATGVAFGEAVRSLFLFLHDAKAVR